MDTIPFIQPRSLNFVANPCTTKSKHKLLYVKNIWRTFHPDFTGSKQNLKWWIHQAKLQSHTSTTLI